MVFSLRAQAAESDVQYAISEGLPSWHNVAKDLYFGTVLRGATVTTSTGTVQLYSTVRYRYRYCGTAVLQLYYCCTYII
eukprot:SAG25_NODE_470_length_7663_cov_2.756114_5_plen_79_part_00